MNPLKIFSDIKNRATKAPGSQKGTGQIASDDLPKSVIDRLRKTSVAKKRRVVKTRIKAARARYSERRQYSKLLALYESLRILRGKKRPKDMREAMRHHNLIIRAICKQIPKTLQKYASITWDDGTPSEEPAPIWICWLDGPDAMPSFCRRCVSCLLKHSGVHPIRFIDYDNIDSYTFVPAIFKELRAQDKLGLANYCDIIRLCLLYDNGGLWLDVDQLVAKDIPEEMFSKPFVSTKNDYYDVPFSEHWKYIGQGNWTSSILGAWEGNTLIHFLLDAFTEYCSKSDVLIDYNLIDYLLEIARRKFPDAERAIAGHVDNGRYRKLNKAMKEGETAADFAQVIPENTIFNNLSWKNEYPTKTATGDEALYSVFLRIPEADIEDLRN